MGKFIQYQRYLSLNDYEKKLEEIAKGEREKGNKIILTSGAFDFLSSPHISYLRKIKEEYKKENGILFVNVDNDARVKLRKGPSKPVNGANYRGFIVSNLKGIDYVSIHPEEGFPPMLKLALKIKPDYIVQAKPWTEELKKELKSIFLENPLPELVEFGKISDLDFSKISMGQFIQFEQYDGMPSYKKRLEDIVKEEREKGNEIVLTSGSFDFIMPGHISYLNELKKRHPKSSLFVNVANDERVKIRKGKHKPINPAYNRAFIISNLEAVDYATVHPEEKSSPTWQLAGVIKPNYVVQSYHWKKKAKKELKKILGKDYNKTKQIYFFRERSGIHTTDLVKKAMKFFGSDEDYNFSEFNAMQFKELSEKLKRSKDFEEFYKNNPESVDFVQTIKELIEKPEEIDESFLIQKYKKYPENLRLLFSNVLKLKKAWNLASFTELNDFLSALINKAVPKFQKSDEAVNPTLKNLTQKPEDLQSNKDLTSNS